MQSTIIVLFTATIGITLSKDIYCPDSRNDNVRYTRSNDYGLNVFARNAAGSSYAADCYLRYSRTNNPKAATILGDFIVPNQDLVVFIHGWQPNMDGTHNIRDQWNRNAPFSCNGLPRSKINPRNNPEPCPPSDHSAQFWIAKGWNVVYLDWRQYSKEAKVNPAEAKFYKDVYNNKNVVELLYGKLIAFLNLVKWNGNELRFAGHSLGAQLSMLLAAKFKRSRYSNKLKRVALLDHFYSNGKKDYLKKDPKCRDGWWWWQKCSRWWTGEYAREVLLPIVRGGRNPAVIEGYRSSLTSSNPFVGDKNEELNKRIVFTELKPWYYGFFQFVSKHMAADVIYQHCMKWNGNLNNNAPSCRMNTAYLKSRYCPSNGRSKCRRKFVQRGDNAAYTTWDYDDKFSVYNVDDIVPEEPYPGEGDKGNDGFRIEIYSGSMSGYIVMILGVCVVVLLLVNVWICCRRYAHRDTDNNKNMYDVVATTDIDF